jgi:hypothetical protein
MAEGIATLKVSRLKMRWPGRLAADEHVVAPDQEAERAMATLLKAMNL